ncbi:hypothetical protein HYY70_04150 [Candidatus Woesearchaeota archaeon]|nr:hypothetical protein [Candidatus Woesearchaeota archaeon]
MKKVIQFLIVFLLMPIAFADITITTEQPIYNIGNRIKASASVMQSKDFEGLFKLTISCEDYKLQYFLTPFSLEASFRTAVNIPELVVASSMLGNCTVLGDLLTNDNLIVEEKESNGFSVTNQLNVLPVKSKVTALPHEDIQVTGIVNEAFGNSVLKASSKIRLDNNSYTAEVVDGKFDLKVKLSEKIRSGRHVISISASDSKSNSGAASIELDVKPIPSHIKTEISANSLQPGSKIEILPYLFDQADDLINESLEMELVSQRGEKVFKKIVQSNEKLDYEFSQYAEPGHYTLTSFYKNLLSQSSINISAIREINVKYENETVLVENIGNVHFEDELTFILESESKKYPISKKVRVEPGKFISVDLSKEVPSGIYDVIVPLKEGLAPIGEKAHDALQNAVQSAKEGLSNLLQEKQSVLADDVTIHDNRPVLKKIASGLESVSGALVGANGVLTKNPLVAPLILVAIVAILVMRYGRKPIMKLIRGKKEDEEKKENQN